MTEKSRPKPGKPTTVHPRIAWAKLHARRRLGHLIKNGCSDGCMARITGLPAVKTRWLFAGPYATADGVVRGAMIVQQRSPTPACF
jgi:hypothetical protein